MFSCSACLRRAINSLGREQTASVLSNPYRSRQQQPKISAFVSFDSIFVRNHATLRSLRKGHHRRVLVEALAKGELVEGNRRRKQGRTKPVDRKDAAARANNRGHLDVDPETRALERKAAFEAQYLGDPLRLAQAVLDKLREDDIDNALHLVRASEKQLTNDDQGPAKKGIMENVVSWNHIMDWLMSKGETVDSFKVYNEMKKRGHRPDSKTYTILLRGLAQHSKKPNAARDAVKLYNSIYAPNSTVTPNTIHTNAAINVCARVGDMDSIWGLAGRLPERGSGAPDRLTYTTILNALQNDARLKAARVISAGGPQSDVQKVYEEAIGDGRKLWMDVIRRWQRADLLIDERLVCAMGRLLLISERRSDAKDVFDLVAQTMNLRIPNQDGNGSAVKEDGENTSSETENTTGEDELGEQDSETLPAEQSSQAVIEASNNQIYTTPGNNTLSMVLEAATIAKQPGTGKLYWDMLTSPTGSFMLSPDPQNFTSYLRILRLSRASKAVLDILRQPWPQDIANRLYKRGTFVIAMSTCIRDKNNQNVFDTATKILEIMHETTGYDVKADEEQGLQQLDMEPKVLTMYLSLAIATTKGMAPGLSLEKKSNGDYNIERDLEKNNVTRALKELEPKIRDVKRLIGLKVDEEEFRELPQRVKNGMRKKGNVNITVIGERFADLVGFLRGVIGAYDRIIAVNDKLEGEGKQTFDQEFVRDCLSQKRKLTAFLGKVGGDRIKPEAQQQKTGLWEGYDANANNAIKPAKEATAEEEEEEDDEFEDDDDDDEHLTRHAGRQKLQHLLRRESFKKRETEATRRLSKRQVRERERERREMKIRSQYPPSSLKPRRTERQTMAPPSKFSSTKGPVVHKGWGTGYDSLVRASGGKGKNEFADLR